MPPRSSGTLDLGFSLELEGDSGASAADPIAIPFPGARVASEGQAAAAADEQLPTLAPPTSKTTMRGGAMRPVAKRGRIPLWAIIAASVVLAGGAGVAVMLLTARKAPTAEELLQPVATDLAADSLAAYQSAADILVQAVAPLQEEGDSLRARAAEVILLEAVVHGAEAAKIGKAEQLTAAIGPSREPNPARNRARALLALAKDKSKEAAAALGDEKSSPEGQLVLGLVHLAQDKPSAAVEVLRQYTSARPDNVAGAYVLARALEQAGKPEASKQYQAVLARNPNHFGAALGLARLEASPDKRLGAVQLLLDQKKPAATGREQAEANLLWGQTAQALGRSNEALAALHKATSLDSRLTEAHLALGEALLYDGNYAEAMTAMSAAGAAIEATRAGKFARGGALITNGKIDNGLKLVNLAAKDAPKDPRGPFWTGVAASLKQPPDLVASDQGYREALKLDPKFLPASLKLAALLQQQNKAQESLTVLRAAEEAGAPPAVLQLAWGDALIVAKEPAQAEEVFRKVLDREPKSGPARLGVAAALQAQDKLQEAKEFLETTLKELPNTLGLRERLAVVCLKMGKKDEALARYQEELKAGRSTAPLRLAVARLAIELKKYDLAQSETKKVLDENPRNPEAAYTMARVFEARGDTPQALTEYRRALAWEKTALYSLAYGRALAKVGKDQEALIALDNATGLAEGRMERARLYFRRGELEKALADFQEAVKLDPNLHEALIYQGLCHDKMGHQDKAEKAWRDALRVAPDAPEPHYRLGRMEMDHGKPNAAIEHFRKAISKIPEKASWESEIHFQLGQAFLLTNSKPNAIAAFKKYLDVAPPEAPARPEAEQHLIRLGGVKHEGVERLDNQRLQGKR